MEKGKRKRRVLKDGAWFLNAHLSVDIYEHEPRLAQDSCLFLAPLYHGRLRLKMGHTCSAPRLC